ncbi:MAG: SDR family NAD(P)-dependent oxidoreductase [Proteobacteria bacterium]|nr:SDR family NAD(P)-dependent oxidoreductase [Pseudomonadota bacterium]
MRRVLVTGANKGIGLAIVEAVLDNQADAFVLLGSRSAERGRAAVAGLIEKRPSWADRLQLLEIDVASDASVARAAGEVRRRFGVEPEPLYGLVNNAGVGFRSQSLRSTLEVNTLGVQRVCEAFLALMNRRQGRIVNITSASGPNYVSDCSPAWQRFFRDPRIERTALQSLLDDCFSPQDLSARGLSGANPYGLSKACANSYTMLLAREHPHLHINACTPGFIATDMTRPYADSQGGSPAELGMKPPAEGTRAPLHLLFGKLEGNGRYYGSDAQRSPLHRYRAPGTPPYSGD